MKNWLCAVAALCLFLASCKKDDPVVVAGSTNWPGATVKASFVGQVLDEQGAPISDAAVRVGSKSATTDANGIFVVRNQSVNSARAIVSAYKAGYFDAFRTFFVQNKSEQRLVIRLLKKQNSGSFAASAGGKVAVAGGAAVDFSANSITKNGQIFSGKVNVAAKWIDPTDADLAEKTPGGLRGLGTDGSETGLRTFGMLGVELTDDAGQKLEITSGKKAKISLPIPSSLASAAPATIVLWHFSETEGIWVEAGTATKIGSEYVAEVAHFSWWNCDAPFPTIKLKLCLTDLQGNPLPNMSVQLVLGQSGSFYSSAFAQTDSSGCVEGLVPSNQPIRMDVLPNVSCGGAAFTQNIGPFSADTDLGTIAINPNGQNGQLVSAVISGRLVDCSGQPIAAGYALTSTGGYALVDAQGFFSQTIQFCSNAAPTTVTVSGFDSNLGKTSPPQTRSFGPTVDFGDIAVCDDLDEYVRYTLDGGAQETLQVSLDSSFVGNSIYVSGYDPAKNSAIYFGWNHNQAPANGLPLVFLNIYTLTSQIQTDPSAPTFTVTTDMTSYPLNVGDYLIGTFAGSFVDQGTGVLHTISGSYRTKRKW